MKTDDLEILKIVAISEPVNIQAARVTRFKNEYFNKENNDKSKLNSYGCPPIRSISSHQRINPEFIDFTGIKKGRITVIGLFAGYQKVLLNNEPKFINNGVNRWVVRCLCGRYELRRTKSLKRIDNIEDEMCTICNQEIRGIRDKDFLRQYGVNRHEYC